jgi:hypothetical protein
MYEIPTLTDAELAVIFEAVSGLSQLTMLYLSAPEVSAAGPANQQLEAEAAVFEP